ncbi:allophanate hydrolase subunit 1 [Rubritalea spongiae]|uniref:Allophanate hydrolase subunit 1 n=1 Tax=Rubritalea spongiae TaxID=430797 RepID=A0ABW5E4K1_9BACT
MKLSYQLLHYGLGDWLLSFDTSDCVQALTCLQKNLSITHICETVVGYESLLIRTDGNIEEHALKQQIDTCLSSSSSTTLLPTHHDIPVLYNGPDLQEVAQLTNISERDIIELHSAPLYTVRFLGFSPGFAYLDGLDPKLHLPRRSSPRPKMAAGAVAIGAAHAGIYSIPSPGGWNWLGNTDHSLFDKHGSDASAFTLRPGDTLRFNPLSA